ncbi:MAG: DUF2470 domain-containing protein [Proteobacteria bacterium]|nr:DUF2470 domain-containing protein [Pseudomonadota bacterium]MDA1022091.1 DUF2470 domain-containing protein [Pseudomonadota bacterium]
MATRPKKLNRTDFVRASRLQVRRARSAILSTVMNDDGWPYGSLISVAFDVDASPIMLFSNLSDHTQNLYGDKRAALLFEEGSRLKNPQTGPRVTVMGKIQKTKEPRHQKRFLALHPEAALYAGFGDFNFFRMKVDRIHFVGGFAQAVWLKPKDLLSDAKAASALAKAETGVLNHMNGDHADAVDHYAHLLGRRGKGWQMTGIDPDGADLRLGGRTARLAFEAPISDRQGVREELVRLAGLDKPEKTKK